MLRSEVQETPFCSLVEMTNGAWVLCKKIPPMLLNAFDRHHQEPKIPKREVRVLGGNMVMEEDPTDPQYLEALEAFGNKQAFDFLTLAMDFMVLIDETQEEMDERNASLEKYGIDASDEQARIEGYALDDPEEDVRRLTTEIMRISTVTTKEVERASDSFPAPVDGTGREEAEDAIEAPDLRGDDAIPVSSISET